MSENVTNGMTPKQRQAAESLASGATVEYASMAAKVTERTLYRWLQDDLFVSGVREYQRQATEGHLRALTGELAEIRTVILTCRDDTEASWQVRLRACDMLENSLLRWREAIDVEERLLALEAAIN